MNHKRIQILNIYSRQKKSSNNILSDVITITLITLIFSIVFYSYEIGYADYFGYNYSLIKVTLFGRILSIFSLSLYSNFTVIIVLIFTIIILLYARMLSPKKVIPYKTKVKILIPILLLSIKYLIIPPVMFLLIKYLVSDKHLVSFNYIIVPIYVILLLINIQKYFKVLDRFKNISSFFIDTLNDYGSIFTNYIYISIFLICMSYSAGYNYAKNKKIFESYDNGTNLIINHYNDYSIVNSRINVLNTNKVYFFLKNEDLTNKYITNVSITNTN